MHCWGDIILKYPELVPELPEDVVVLDWGYEADHPFHEQCAIFAEAGRSFFVCPGTSSWLSLVGAWWSRGWLVRFSNSRWRPRAMRG